MKLLKGTVIGTIVFFFLGWLIWGILLADYGLANYNQCAMKPNEEMIWWSMIFSNLIYAFFITLILNWSKAINFMDGIKTGALIGFLFSASIDLSFYSMTTIFNSFESILVDIFANTILAAVTGMAIVLFWGKDKSV